VPFLRKSEELVCQVPPDFRVGHAPGRSFKPETHAERWCRVGDSLRDETDSSVIRSENAACYPAAF